MYRHYDRTNPSHGQRQYPCQHCNSVFDTKEELDTHHTVHSMHEEGRARYKKKRQSTHTSHTQDTPTASSSNIGASLAGTDTSSLISNSHKNSSNINSHSITFHGHGGSGMTSTAAADDADSSFVTDKTSGRIGEHQCHKCGRMFRGDRSRYIRHLRSHGEPATPCTKPDCLDLFVDVHAMRVHRACHDGYISCAFPDCHEGFSSAHELIKHETSHGFDFAEQEQQEFKEIKRGISPTAEPRGNYVVMRNRIDKAVGFY